jgi:hypothetical protein
MKHLTWMTLAVALSAYGCEGKSEEPATEPQAAEPAAEPAEQAEPAEPAEPAEAAEADDVVTAEDFEEEAAEAITEENLEDEVARLEEALRDELGE